MEALAEMLASYMRSPVIDKTGLEGPYQVSLEVAIPGANPSSSSAEPVVISQFSMVERLGPKLEQRKASVQVLVVDHVGRIPTAN